MKNVLLGNIRYWDSNPQPLEHEPYPITTRPGLPHVSGFESNLTYTTYVDDSCGLDKLIFFKNGPIPASFSVYFHLYHMSHIKLIKAQMVCLGFEPGVAGWKAQTNPLSYGGTPN